ncbi:MAG: MarR family transcriptional regulator [Alphaproteobacteria bacterium]|nr:MarR family transcriptional regulator [Alphaproteobacteria bacterium]
MSENTNANNDPKIFRLFTETGIINQLSVSALEEKLPYGLKISQFSLLNHFVRLGGPFNPIQLARAFQVTKGAMTNTIKRLEVLGFVEVKSDPEDGRGKLVDITEAGRKAREDSLQNIYPLIIELQAVLSEEEIDTLLPLLTKIRTYMDARRDTR